jgi:DNA polymerase III epsilon subunit-like protein
VVRSYSSLIRHDANEAEHVNKIHVELLTEAPDAATVWRGVERFGQCAEAVVCHGVEFDRRMVPASILSTVPWICSMDGGIWPHGSAKRESLVSLALSAGLGISSAHRAAADVDILARLFTRMHELGVPINAMLQRGLRPRGRFVVAERGFDEARNAMVKANGFTWDAGRREWSRTMAIEDAEDLPFRVERAN